MKQPFDLLLAVVCLAALICLWRLPPGALGRRRAWLEEKLGRLILGWWRRQQRKPLPEPGPEVPKLSFFAIVERLTEAEWMTHKVYVYRRRWGRFRSEDLEYLTMARHAIDAVWLLEQYGSGRYRLVLKDARKTICSGVCEIEERRRGNA